MGKISFPNKTESAKEKAFAPFPYGTEMPRAATSHTVITEDTKKTKANAIRIPEGKNRKDPGL